jgi:hypothetical protein
MNFGGMSLETLILQNKEKRKMKKANLTIIATIVAVLFVTMLAFQPVITEAGNGVMPPAATPTPKSKIAPCPVGDNKSKVKGKPAAQSTVTSLGRENSIECLKAKSSPKAAPYNLGDTGTHRQRRRRAQ